jgi:FixJ family two-component response regulator
MMKMLNGMPNKRIAAELDIGLRTVELRRANVLRKMQVDSLAELVRLAMLAGKMPAIES